MRMHSIVKPVTLATLFLLGASVATAQSIDEIALRRGIPPQPNDALAPYKSDIEAANPILFLLQRSKTLSLTEVQKDSLKIAAAELESANNPAWEEISAIFKSEKALEPTTGRRYKVVVTRVEGQGAEPSPPPRMGTGVGRGMSTDGRSRQMLPSSVRQAQIAIDSMITVFRQRAWGQLTESQRHAADSLYTIFMKKHDRDMKQNWKSGK